MEGLAEQMSGLTELNKLYGFCFYYLSHGFIHEVRVTEGRVEKDHYFLTIFFLAMKNQETAILGLLFNRPSESLVL